MIPSFYKTSESLGLALQNKSWKIVTAESCTGGGVASAITEIPGASSWFDSGFVTYSDPSKIQQLNVRPETLKRFGAVSEEVVREMVLGALELSGSHIGISISGIAGPSGGVLHKPVGTVCIAWGSKDKVNSNTFLFAGDRPKIRESAIRQSLHLALRFVREASI